MTAVANLPSFGTINRPAWGDGSQTLNGPNYREDGRSSSISMFAPAPRKTLSRSSSSSSIASNASTSSTNTVIASDASSTVVNGGPVGGNVNSGINGCGRPAPSQANAYNGPMVRKRPLRAPASHKQNGGGSNGGDGPADFLRGVSVGRGQQMGSTQTGGLTSLHQLPPFVPGQMTNGLNGNGGANGVNSINGNNIPRQDGGDTAAAAAAAAALQHGQPVLYLLSLNGTFDRKTISVPFLPDTLRIGRQTNRNTTPTTVNGYFDSKVLSRQHAEIWADAQGKIWIRDIKSSNGTFVNGTRLSAENRESEPHELQTNDRLELGIDIVSEDQKQVVHHKVSAKVEHAGFINPSNNLLDMSISDLDASTNGGMLLGGPLNGLPFRGRPGSAAGGAAANANLGPAGRVAPTSNMAAAQNNVALQRGLWLTGPSTEAIVKKLNQEMRLAKQQSQDLLRTQEFVKALLSKDDLKADKNHHPNNKSKADTAAADGRPHMVNGHGGVPFRADAKTRFSDPPAPPPQQPLPEKPDVPSLKRGGLDRPKLGNMSPVRPDVLGQVLQLTEALNTAKREMDTQHARLRELEDRLLQEQEARRSAEALAQRLEKKAATASATATASAAPTTTHKGVDGVTVNGVLTNGMVNGTHRESGDEDHDDAESVILDAAVSEEADAVAGAGGAGTTGVEAKAVEEDGSEAKVFRTRIDTMTAEMDGMKRQLQAFRERAEKAEAERDADRETLAEMVVRIRQRDADNARLAREAADAATAVAAATRAAAAAEAAAAAAAATALAAREASSSRSRSRGSSPSSEKRQTSKAVSTDGANTDDDSQLSAPSRTNTITPATVTAKASSASALSSSAALVKAPRERSAALQQGVPYASMVGVMLLGMGLMAYLNGWRVQPPRLDR